MSATGTMRPLGHLRPRDYSQPWDHSGPWNYSGAFIPFKRRVSEEVPSLVLLCEASNANASEWRDLGQRDETRGPYRDRLRSGDSDSDGFESD